MSLARAIITPNTEAAPHISHFISSIAGDGFNDIPPVSKVIPFPTRTIGFSPAFPPLCSIVIILEGSSLPLPTLKKEPILSLAKSFSLKVEIFNFGNGFFKALTFLSIILGVHKFAGISPKCLAAFIASPTAKPTLAEVLSFFKAEDVTELAMMEAFFKLGFTTVLFLELPKIYADASICLQQISVNQLSSFPSGHLHANITEISCFPRELAIFEIDLNRSNHR